MRVKKNWLVSVLSFSLALCITLSSLLSTGIGQGTMVAKADTSAKSRVQTFIGLAAGKSGTSLPDIGQLTQDELQFLGVYLSNFYVPFSTELGANVSNEDTLQKQKENMIDALKLNLNFNETVAEELVDNIIGLARSNSRELEFRVSETYQPNNNDDYKVLQGFETNYYTFIGCMSGGMFDTNIYTLTDTDRALFGLVEYEVEYLYRNVGYYQGNNWYSYRGGDVEYWTESEKRLEACRLMAINNIGHFKPEYFDWEGDKVVGIKKYSDLGIDENSDTNWLEYHEQVCSDMEACWFEYENKLADLDLLNDIDEGCFYFPYNYGYFGYTDNSGKFIPVFDCGFHGYSTACMDAFALCWNNLNTDMGYGSAFFDFTDDEIGKSLSDISDSLDTWTDDLVYQTTAYSSKIYVDCFGDILIMGNNHQYVGIPGCLNPYTWVIVDTSGTNKGEDSIYYKPGYSRYLVNAFDMQEDKFIIAEDQNEEGYYNVGLLNPVYTLYSRNMEAYYNDSADSKGNMTDVLMPNFISSAAQFVNWIGIPVYNLADNVVSELGEQYAENTWYFGNRWYIVRGSTTSKISSLWWDGDMSFMSRVERGAGGVKPWMYLGSAGGFTTHDGMSDSGNGLIMSPSPCLIHNVSETYYSNTVDERKFDFMVIPVTSPMCYIDNLGMFGFDSSNSDIAYDSIVFSEYMDKYGQVPSDYVDWSNQLSSAFSGISSKVESGAINSYQMSDICAVSLYTTYAVAGLYKDDDSKADTIGELGIRMNRGGLPSINNTPLLISDSYADDLLKTEITNMIYYALKPDSTDYVKIAIKNKVNAILVDWHNDMVGSQGMGYTTGTTYYRTNYGYVTTPDLSEMQWTDSLLNLYDTAIPILIIFMVISMLIAFVTGTMSFQKAVMGTIIFAAFLLVPVNAINYVCQTCNSFTNRIYGDKFVYWALVQEETYGTALDTAASGDSYENYIKTLYAANEMNQGGESIVLKWQAPKKMASLMLSSDDKSLLDNLQGNLLNSSLLSNALSGEAYLDGASQYMYRDYSDLANFSRFIHHSTNSGSPIKRATANGISESGTWNIIHGVHPNDAYMSYVQAGYTNGSQSWTDVAVLTSMYSDVYNDVTKDSIIEDVRVGNISQSEYVGINQDLFNVSLAYFNNTKQKAEGGVEEDLTYESAIRNNLSSNNTDIDEWLVKYSESEYNSLMVYGVMSESPYYYFSWNMYDNGMSTSANAGGGYKTMLLSDQDGGYFYNMSGNGELKDFMNMRNLFYHVIPYLKQGNDLVRAWDDRYGIFVYDGVPTDEGYLDDPTIQGDDSLKYKYWHNLNVARLYTVYTPWLDLMYDCDYAEPCYVKVMGTKYYIEDPLNPWCYPAERPMIFSESEMYDYGLTEGDLTEVERKILKFNRESQEDMYELLNYYNFSDLSLNTAAAMQCTFNFNRIFSETGFFSNNINLYPQSFEIKDFSYDAFLRFILSTTTGESLAGSTDFYGDLVKKSSTTTAILLLVCDILSQYVVPFAKVVFLIAIFVSSVLLITVTVFRVDPEFKFVGKLAKGIAVPLLEFCAVTMGFAYVVSLFMGVGNNAVTQSDNVSISLGDPNMVLIAMCVLNLVCVVLYVKLLINLWNDIKTHASLIKNHVSGLVGGAVLMGVGGIKSSMSGMGSGSSGVGGYNETGTGKESARATTRASKSKDALDEKADRGRTETGRMAETKRATVKNHEGKSDEKRSSAINETINSGRNKVNHESGNTDERANDRGSRRPIVGMGYNSDGTPFGKGTPERDSNEKSTIKDDSSSRGHFGKKDDSSSRGLFGKKDEEE